jgi:geranylgeranyl reductase family protein
VTIVGAGPAGSTAAKILSEMGFKVILIDKEKFPRDKPCGGGIPQRVIKRFPYILYNDLIENTIFGGIAHTPDLKDEVTLKRDKPLGATILRRNFDYELVKLAINSGTIFMDEKLVTDIKILDDKAKIIINDGSSIDSKLVIGADGVWSTIAKKSGLDEGNKNVGLCIFEEYHIDSSTLDRYFGEKRLSHIFMKFQGINGYGWIFPKKNHLNLGICAFTLSGQESIKQINLREIYNNYIRILKERKIIPNNLESIKIKGGQLPLYPLEKTYSDRVILCGDAAGFINPFSGEGIYYAMLSSEIAANIISKALNSGKTDEGFLSRYQKIWKKEFGRDIKLYYMVGKKQSKRANTMVTLIKKDKIFADIILGILLGDISIYEYRWKLRRRFIYVYLKEKLVRSS